MIIYKATNITNGKVYIGATIQTLQSRKKQHINCAKKNIDNGKRYFYNAIRKYSPDNFIWEIIDSADNYDNLMKKEKYWIKKYNAFGKNGYNLCEGGNNTIGYKHTPEAKKKMSEKAQNRIHKKGKDSPCYGKKLSKESKEKISKKVSGKNNPMYGKTFYDIWVEKYGKEKANKMLIEWNNKKKLPRKKNNKPMSEETRKKISEANKLAHKKHPEHYLGHYHTEEQKEKWSKERKGRKLHGKWLENIRKARKKNCKKVINIDTGEIFNSIAEAQDAYNLKNGIANVCKGIKKTAAGQHWKFYNDYLNENNINHDNTVPS